MRQRGLFLAFVLIVISYAIQTPSIPRVQAQSPAVQPVYSEAVGFAISRPASEVAADAEALAPPAGQAPSGPSVDVDVPNRELPGPANADLDAPGEPDGALQLDNPDPGLGGAPLTTFNGLSSGDDAIAFGFRAFPPDTNGDVGPNHYVQQVNLLVRVWNKSGVALTAPFKLSSLFAPVGGLCARNDNGDPVVLYDPMADRWVLSQLAFAAVNVPPYHECIAISRTGDPTGTYFLYDFITPGNEFPDYPKLGVWPDAYYMTANQFFLGGNFDGAGAFAFDRAKMIVGSPTAGLIYFSLNLATHPEGIGGMLPSDFGGLIPPPAGRPNTFSYFIAKQFGATLDALRLFDFHVSFANPPSSTFTERPESPVAVAAFDPRSPVGRADIPQPPVSGVITPLDSLSDRLMHRLQYRNLSGTESLVVNHTVNVSSSTTFPTYRAGVRLYQLTRSLGGGFSVAVQMTLAGPPGPPADTNSRWMGSAATDNQGNLAVGYSVSSLATFPSIRYAGRTAAGVFQGERTLVAGSGVQTGSNRWGDYSALAVDPADDCTFWYTTEHYTAASQASSPVGWLTRIGSFKFDECTPPPRATISGTVSTAGSGTPIAGATIGVNGAPFTTTGAVGTYSIALAPGTYTLTAAAPNHALSFATVTVPAGATTQDFSLTPTGADIFVTKTAPPTVGGGAPLAYSIVVGNHGPLTSTVTLSDVTPTNTIFLSAATTQGSCATPAPGGTGTISCAIGSVAPGALATVTLMVHVTAPTGTIANTATVTASTPDIIIGNNSATATTLVTCLPVIHGGPIGTSSPDYPTTNGVQTGRITRNGVASTCAAPKAFPGVFDPAGSRAFDAYQFTNPSSSPACVTIDFTTGCGTGFFTVAYRDSFNPTNLMQNYLADIGSSVSRPFSFILPGGAKTVFVVHELNPGVSCGSYQFSVSLPCALADLSVTQGATAASVVAGSDVSFPITVSNRGPNAASNVTVTDTLPAGVSFLSIAAPSEWTCTTPAVGSGGSIACTKPSVASGESGVITPTVRANCDLSDGTTLIDSVTVSSTTGDASPFNNSASAAVTVSNPPPVLTLPANVSVGTGPGATICARIVSDAELGTATATDNCPGVTITRTGVPAGNIFPVGTTTIIYTATDSAGATTTATQTVTVVDTTAPTITDVSATPDSLWPPNHGMVDITVSYTASDICGSVTTSLSVAGNEPVNGTGDGDTAPDWEIIDDHHVRLRAERAGTGTGRIYTITITAVDLVGNTTTQSVVVTVPHDRR